MLQMYHFFTRVLFITGVVVGVIVAIIIIKVADNKNVVQKGLIKSITFNNSVYKLWFESKNLKRKKLPFDVLRYSNRNYLTEAKYLFAQIKIMCIVLVRNAKNAEAAKNTWLKNCNQVKYVNISQEKKRRIFPIKKPKDNTPWIQLCKALISAKPNFHWILIVNDDTFTLMENLRLLVAGLNASENYYLGHAVTFWTITYNMGQAGYVLSLGSVRTFKTTITDSSSCSSEVTYLNQEDMYLGKYLASMNITPMDTRDALGLSRFHAYNWQNVMFSGNGHYKLSVYPVTCCSPYSITFQATEAHKIYMYYYLLYELQVFDDGNLGNKPAPTPMPEEEVWGGFLRERGINATNISSRSYYKIWEEVVHDPTAFAQELRKSKYDYYD